MSEDELSGADIVMLIEALDALLPNSEDNHQLMTPEERERWLPYCQARHRLKRAVRTSFYDNARG